MNRRQLGKGVVAGAILAAVGGEMEGLARVPDNADGEQPVQRSVAWPDPLFLENGKRIGSRAEFEQQRRGEILQLFAENVYGQTPRATQPVSVVSTETSAGALNGLAVRKQITLAVGALGERTWNLLLYTPANAEGPVPAIIGLNFEGNHTVSPEPGIHLKPIWVRDPTLVQVRLAKELSAHVLEKPDPTKRGVAACQWPIEMIIQRGYALATMYAGDIEPDFISGIAYGVRPLFFSAGQSLPNANDWGAIGAWAWGMSRIADVLNADPAIDSSRLISFGFSRFGKTALWAAAQDRRFSLVLSNESGQAGATLSHRQRGESIDHLMLAFPYWFCANYQHYLGRVKALPVDGHLLLALIAPRPLYVGSAIDDPYSDPEGEFLSAEAVSPVYALYGETGLPRSDMPALDHSIGDVVAYHVRSGGHDVTEYDWNQYLNFANRAFRRRSGD